MEEEKKIVSSSDSLKSKNSFYSLQSNVSSASAPSSPPPAPIAPTTNTVPPGARSSSPCSATSNGPPSSRCCDTGRPLFTDPITGQTVCSCQYDQSILNYQRLASGMATGPPLSMYSAPYSAETMAAYFPALSSDQPPFYPNPVSTSSRHAFIVSAHLMTSRKKV